MLKIYSIRDDAAQFFIQPFFCNADAQATRMFVGSLGDSFPHRADFKLYRVGSFNTETGQITSEDPVLIIAGLSIAETLDPRVRPVNKE